MFASIQRYCFTSEDKSISDSPNTPAHQHNNLHEKGNIKLRSDSFNRMQRVLQVWNLNTNNLNNKLIQAKQYPVICIKIYLWTLGLPQILHKSSQIELTRDGILHAQHKSHPKSQQWHLKNNTISNSLRWNTISNSLRWSWGTLRWNSQRWFCSNPCPNRHISTSSSKGKSGN